MNDIHKVLKEGGLRKIATALYMFTALCLLLWQKCLDGAVFAECSKLLIAAVFAGNALEHFAKKDTSTTPEVKAE